MPKTKKQQQSTAQAIVQTVTKTGKKPSPVEQKKERAHRHQFVDNVQEELEINSSYLLLLIFSTVIATLGLIVDSTAVVIGAMIISPLFWPIMGIALSIFTSRRKFAQKSIISLVISILFVIGISAIIGSITPFSEPTTEILSRTQPTIIDLFIALASSVIGVLAVYYPRISSTAAGVAISIALLPPLAVSGIGISLQSWEMFYRAFLLFSTNVAAMMFAALITLYLLQFRPRRRDERRFQLSLVVTFVTLLILSIPLSVFLGNSLDQERVKNQVNTILQKQITSYIEGALVDDVFVQYVPSLDDEVSVQATVYINEGEFLTEAQRLELISDISSSIGITASLELQIVDTLTLRKEEDTAMQQEYDRVEQLVKDAFMTAHPSLIIESIDFDLPMTTDTDTGQSTIAINEEVRINIVVHQAEDDEAMTFAEKEALQTRLTQSVPYNVKLDIQLIPVELLQPIAEEDILLQSIENTLSQDIRELSKKTSIRNVTVTEHSKKKYDILVKAEILLPMDIELLEEDIVQMESHIGRATEQSADLRLTIIRTEVIQ